MKLVLVCSFYRLKRKKKKFREVKPPEKNPAGLSVKPESMLLLLPYLASNANFISSFTISKDVLFLIVLYHNSHLLNQDPK